MLKRDGTVIIADERVQESFVAPGDELERFFYVASIMFCLLQSREESPSVATGTAIRPKTMTMLLSSSARNTHPRFDEMWVDLKQISKGCI